MRKQQFTFRSRIPASADSVFRWHASPDALEQLTPPWERVQILERTGGIQNGGRAVLLCRFVPGVRSIISIPAGISHMPLPPFLLYSTLGMGIWAAVLALIGQALGQNYELVDRYLGPISYVVIGGLILTTVVMVLRRRRKAKVDRGG